MKTYIVFAIDRYGMLIDKEYKTTAANKYYAIVNFMLMLTARDVARIESIHIEQSV